MNRCPMPGAQLNRRGVVPRNGERFAPLPPIEPAEVAESVWEALQSDNFLILPHPKVAEYYRSRATDTDLWLTGMRKLQRRLDAAQN